MKTKTSMIHPFGLSLVKYEITDKTINMILKGWKKAFHKICHQLGKE